MISTPAIIRRHTTTRVSERNNSK